MRVDLTDKLGLQSAVAALTQLLELLLTEGVRLPLSGRALVATDVEVGIGEDIAQLGDDVLGKLHGLGIGHVEHIRADATIDPHLRGVVGVTTVLGIGMHSSHEVSGHVHLGQYVDMTLSGIAYHLSHLLLGIVEGAILATRLRTFASPIHLPVLLDTSDGSVIATLTLGTDGGEQRILLDLGTPSLVVGQVPVEDVHLVDSHQVDHLLHLLNGKEMAAHVEHKATVCKAWLILDARHGQGIHRTFIARLTQYHVGRKQTHEALHGIVHTVRSGSLDSDALLGDLHRVALRSQRSVLLDNDVGLTLRCLAAKACSRVQGSDEAHHIGQHLALLAAIGKLACGNGKALFQDKLALTHGCRPGSRYQAERLYRFFLYILGKVHLQAARTGRSRSTSPSSRIGAIGRHVYGLAIRV